ncbi:unnamed protein product [Chrysoparadoxa australica]
MSTSTATGSQNGVMGPLINDQYRITKRLGGGSFGDIYLGIGLNGEKVAVKFEKNVTRCPQLRHEYKVYREMQNTAGFGRVYYFGSHNNYNAMVMDLLGPSLEDLFTKCGRQVKVRFTLKTVLQLADQMLERMDAMHSRHLIHRDVKPANYVLGIGKGCQTCYCIDFGLSTRYRHPRTLQHIPYREGRSLTGTPRYASINNHLGVEQSRRDDLESVGYVLIYFLKGSLPWQGLKARNAKRKYKMIMERKQAISIQQLCQGLPQQFTEYLAYCRSLKFEAKPNVSYLRGLFRELYKAQGYGTINGALEWDWTKFETGDAGVHVVPEPGDGPDGIFTPALDNDVNVPKQIERPKTGAAYAEREQALADQASPTAPVSADQSPHLRADDQAAAAAVAKQNSGLDHRASTGRVSSTPRDSKKENQSSSRGRGTNGGGGWSMWNLRPKTSGSGFWGGKGGVKGWSNKENTSGARRGKPGAEASDNVLPGKATGSAAERGTSRVARPHTAHGGRASDADGGASAHVVAGARGMMRYRDGQNHHVTASNGSNGGSGAVGAWGSQGRQNSGDQDGPGHHRHVSSSSRKSQGSYRRKGSGGGASLGYSNAPAARPGTSGTGITTRPGTQQMPGHRSSPYNSNSAAARDSMRQRPPSARSRGLMVNSRKHLQRPSSTGSGLAPGIQQYS